MSVAAQFLPSLSHNADVLFLEAFSVFQTVEHLSLAPTASWASHLRDSSSQAGSTCLSLVGLRWL